jgi:hypothetical protein
LADQWDFGDEMSGVSDNASLRTTFKKAREGAKERRAPRSGWQRFTDEVLSSTIQNPFGGEAAARALIWLRDKTGIPLPGVDKTITTKNLSRVERAKLRELDQRRERDDKEGYSAKKLAIDLAGNIVGGVDPTYVVAPGATPIKRVAAQAMINSGMDAASQGVNITRGVRDEYNPWQTGIAGAGGAILQGAGEGISKAVSARRIVNGSRQPNFNQLVSTIVDLEGGGTLAKPKTSPKGAMGVMQVMPATARKPGFGIRPWNGKTQADLARVGRQYAAALNNKYKGDTAKVLAAYNGGPGRVDGLVKRFGDDWLRHMPKESRNYVRNGLAKMGGGSNRVADSGGVDEVSAPRVLRDDPILAAALDRPTARPDITPEEQSLLDAANDGTNWTTANTYGMIDPEAGPPEVRTQSTHVDDGINDYTDPDLDNMLRQIGDNDEFVNTFIRLSAQNERWQPSPENLNRYYANERVGNKVDDDMMKISDPRAIAWGSIEDLEVRNRKIFLKEHLDLSNKDLAEMDEATATVLARRIGYNKEWAAYYDKARENNSIEGLERPADLLPTDGPTNPGVRDPNAKEVLGRLPPSKKSLLKEVESLNRALDILVRSRKQAVQTGRDTKQIDELMSQHQARLAEIDQQLGLPDVRGFDEPKANDVSPRSFKEIQKEQSDADFEKRFTDGVQEYNKKLQKDVKNKADTNKKAADKYREEGKIPLEVGTRISTAKSRETGAEPWKIVGHYVDAKDPDRYGYRVERGEGDDLETSIMLVSDPKADARIQKSKPDFDRAKDVADWQVVTRSDPLWKRLWKDEGGAYRDRIRVDTSRPYEELGPEEKLIKAVRERTPLAGEQRKLYREERGRRGGRIDRIQQENRGVAGINQQKAALRGQLPRADFESIQRHFSAEDMDTLVNKINNSRVLLPHEKFNASEALMNLLGPEGSKAPTPSELRLLAEVYSEDFIQALLDNRDFWAKMWDHTASTLNIPRALMASADLSAPLRQGVTLIHKKEYWKSFANMFKVAFSERASKDLMLDIKSRPTWSLMRKARLAISDPHSHRLMDREEDFMTDFAEKIPVAGEVVKFSNRAYSGFLNKLRADVFDDFVRKYEDMGINLADDPAQLIKIGRFINAATGRGNLGKKGEAAAPWLNAVFFSPRLISSRIQVMASPVTYMNADPFLRKEAWKSLLAFSGYSLTLAGLAKYGLGWDVEDDPRHPDFMKPKMGNTRFDIMGGFQQYIRLGAQLISNSKVTAKGDEKDLGPGMNEESRRDVFEKFVRNKYGPIASFISDWSEGKDAIGEDFKLDKAILSRLTPMFAQDAYEAIQEYGLAKGAAVAAPAMFGVGSQTYDANAPKENSKKKKNSDPWDFGDSDSDWSFGDDEKPNRAEEDKWDF